MRIPSLAHRVRLIAIADVGMSGTGIGYVEIGGAVPARIIAASRSFAPLTERDERSALANISQTFRESAAAALAALGKTGTARAPDAVYVIAHSPWTESRSLSAEKSFEKDTRITKDLIGTLASTALKDAADVKSDELLEASVTHVELNGYPVAEPTAHSAQHIKVAVLVSTMRKEHRDAIESAAHTAFPGIDVKLRSHVRALVSALHESEGVRNGVIVDVGEEGTTISVIRKDLLDGQESIAAGMHTLLARVSGSGSKEETLGLLAMLEKGTCSTSACDEIMQALSAAEPQITKIFGEGLAKLAAKRRLPNDCVLITHPDVAPWFSRFLARIDFAQFTSTSQPLSVKALGLSDVSSLVSTEASVATDMPLMLAAALVHNESIRPPRA